MFCSWLPIKNSFLIKSSNVIISMFWKKKDTKIGDVWTQRQQVWERERKRREKKESVSNNTRVWLVVMMMMVCEHRAHSWSVSCPSFSRVFFLLSCPLRPYIYTHTPSHHHQLRTRIRIFSSTLSLSHRRERARARAQAAGHNVKVRLFFFLFFLSSFFLCSPTLWSNTSSNDSILPSVFWRRRRKRKNGRQRWHVYVIRFRSLNTTTRRWQRRRRKEKTRR